MAADDYSRPGLGAGYVTYPERHRGMDHGFYPWRAAGTAPGLDWGEGLRLGVWISVAVEWFPLDISGKPFLPMGAPYRPYPDTQTYSQRDYGNRIGIYRMMDAFRAAGVTPSAQINAHVAARYPLLMRHILEEGWEVIAAGLDMDHLHHDGLDPAAEAGWIDTALAILRDAGAVVEGWHSPNWSQSQRTPELLARAGLRYMVDWPNDDFPYAFDTGAGTILSLPAAYELSDRKILHERLNPIDEFEHQIGAALDRYLAEAADGRGRLMALNLSPWLMGQPYRIAVLERLLARIGAMEATRCVTAAEVCAAWARGAA